MCQHLAFQCHIVSPIAFLKGKQKCQNNENGRLTIQIFFFLSWESNLYCKSIESQIKFQKLPITPVAWFLCFFFFPSLLLKAFFTLHQIQIVKCLNRGSKQKPGRYRKYAKSKLVYLVHDFNTPLQLAEYFLWTCGLVVCVSARDFLFTAFK